MSLSIRALCGSLIAVLLLLMANTATAQTQPTNLTTFLAETSPDSGFPFTFVWLWTDNSSGLDQVQIQISVGAPGSWQTLSTVSPSQNGGPSGAELELIKFAAGTKLYFQLVDAQGSSLSQPSNTTLITVPASSFNAPSNAQAADESDGTISVSWTDTNTAEQGVEIWAKAAGGTAFHAQDVFFYQNKPANISGLIPNTSYVFDVRAFQINSAGARVYSAFSNTTSAVSTAPLAAPTSLEVINPTITSANGSTGTSLTLAWQNNSDGATAYQILQRPTGSGAFTVVQTLPGGSSSILMQGLPPGTSLDFAVQTIYVPATGSPTIAMSNIVTQVTEDAITSPHFANAVVGQPFSYTITNSTAQTRTGLTVANLPNGLNWDGDVTISGTPTAAGVTQANLTATFADGWNDLPILAIRVLNGPSASAIGSQNITVGTTPLSLPLATHFSDPDESSAVQVSTSLGNMNFILSDSAAPQTVANFRSYINNGTYAGNLFHRSIGDFIIQGGSYKPGSTSNSFIAPPTLAPVASEYTGVSNTVGTVAFALLSNQPASGTNGFFVNLDNNGASQNDGGAQTLDSQHFTVFARVAGNGMQVAQAIATVPTGTYNVNLGVQISGCSTTKGSASITVPNAASIGSGEGVSGTGIPAGTTVSSVSGSTVVLSAAATAAGSNLTLTFSGVQQFQNWPLNTTNAPPLMNNTQDVSITSITALSSVFNYTASSDDTTHATAAISNGNVVVTGVAQGSANITVTATDLDGNSASNTFAVTVQPSSNATLASLTVSSGSLSPTFLPGVGTSTYAVTVPAGTTSITVTPTTSESHATLTINSSPATSGQPSNSISLPPNAMTPITIVVTAQDGGTMDTYTLNVTNPLATTVAATTIESGFATLNGLVNPNGAATTAFFQYGTTTAYGSTTPAINLGSGTSAVPTLYNLFGLAKSTTYHYRLVVVSGGVTYDGADLTFTTPASSPASWHSGQISALTNPNLNNMADGACTGAVDTGRQTYYYKGTDSNIWCVYLNGSVWTQTQLSNDGNVNDWLTFGTTSGILCYLGKDNQIWSVFWNGTQWTTAQLGTVPVGTTVTGHLAIDNIWNIVYFRTTDALAHCVTLSGKTWVYSNIGTTATANVQGNLKVDPKYHQLYYQSLDNQVWCYYWTGTAWTQSQLTTTANVGGAFSVDESGLTVYYRQSTDSSAGCVFWNGKTWFQETLVPGANINASATSFSDAAPYTVQYNNLYIDGNNQAEFFYFNGSAWTHALLGDGSAGLTGGLSLQPQNHWIFARRSDSNIVLFYYQ